MGRDGKGWRGTGQDRGDWTGWRGVGRGSKIRDGMKTDAGRDGVERDGTGWRGTGRG